MNTKQLMKALEYNGYTPKIYAENNNVTTIKVIDYIFMNVLEVDGVIVTEALYSEMKVSDNITHQMLHTTNLINVIDLMMYLFTNVKNKENVYELIKLYELGNDLDVDYEGYRFTCGTEDGLFYFEMGEII